MGRIIFKECHDKEIDNKDHLKLEENSFNEKTVVCFNANKNYDY